MIWILNLAMVPIFIMDVRQLFLESFGISVVVVEALKAILITVRWQRIFCMTDELFNDVLLFNGDIFR